MTTFPASSGGAAPGGATGDSGPTLALTVGDPAGIGPEIAVRAAAEEEVRSRARVLLVGDADIVRRAAKLCELRAGVRVIGDPGAAGREPGSIDVLDIGAASGEEIVPGRVSAAAGRSAVAAVETATRLALDRQVDAVVTAPINKEAIWAAGSTHLGHTEMLGELTGARESTTMFVVRDMKIFFTTRHTSLREAVAQIDRERVGAAIGSALTALKVFGHPQPRLAVAALNPHGGEGGNFGREEIDHIAPAVEAAKADGAQVSGPVPADSVFHQALQGRYDGVLAQFHDQGHIAAKTVDFDGTVSVTVGLPILRTSVDHGTAFDIAGTGRASHQTMVAAALAAAGLSRFLENIRSAYGG
ncbi:MAG TPA: 4-hydroxythreonine-4-phosphate dehydrogenase PdxA [Trebonia sp.]|nr:4-hydroxythreonine-4-phosphate dehydrogenase PdxA [Trebonia sp.]